VRVAYVQPPLAPDKQPIDYLDLLFAPWPEQAAARIPTDWIVDTLQVIWSAWTPELAATYMARLRKAVATGSVPLQPLSSRAR
jgi:hypothetical protein